MENRSSMEVDGFSILSGVGVGEGCTAGGGAGGAPIPATSTSSGQSPIYLENTVIVGGFPSNSARETIRQQMENLLARVPSGANNVVTYSYVTSVVDNKGFYRTGDCSNDDSWKLIKAVKEGNRRP